MDIRKELRRKIDKKLSEINEMQTHLQEIGTRVRESYAYVAALEETLKLLPRETPGESAAIALRADSAIANARESILKAGKPLHINEILKALGKPITHDSKASLSGSLGAYVRDNLIFTRPAPNTFGLVEFQQDLKITEEELPPNFGVLNGQQKAADEV
jgi:hypothetical protein